VTQKEIALTLFKRQPNDYRISKIIATIPANPTSRIHDLAIDMQLSVSRLEHLFKEETGIPLHLYLKVTRLYMAMHLLASNNEKIRIIAKAAGYSHSSSFIRAFKMQFGESPQSYRHRVRG
jgi:AraC-like DNA-binding protein